MAAPVKFEQYHQENPDVYELFKKYALQSAAKRPHFSAYAVFHRMRWQQMIVEGNDDYKLNNNYIPNYVRLFEEEYPDLKGFFETRRMKS